MQITKELLLQWDLSYEGTEIYEALPPEGYSLVQILNTFENASFRLLLAPEILGVEKLRAISCKWARRALEQESSAGRQPHADAWEALALRESGVAEDVLRANALAQGAATSAQRIASDAASGRIDVSSTAAQAAHAATEAVLYCTTDPAGAWDVARCAAGSAASAASYEGQKAGAAAPVRAALWTEAWVFAQSVFMQELREALGALVDTP